jgi:Na+/H+-dicarboxylate symporter
MAMFEWIILVSSAIGIFVGAICGYKFVLHHNEDESIGWILLFVFVGMALGGFVFLILSALAIFVPIVFTSIVVALIAVGKMEKVRRNNIAVAEAKEALFQKEISKSFHRNR